MTTGFVWNGQRLNYFDHPYNRTALNMRRVEIPIARWTMAKFARISAAMLEIGNVLGHYQTRTWPVIDLHERGAIHADVRDWSPKRRVELVVCISTIEHIGFGRYADGRPPDPAAVMARLRGFLSAGGRALVTAPTAYNPFLDSAVSNGTLGADRAWFMRVRADGGWDECTMAEAMAMPPRACSGRWSGGLMIFEMEGTA